VSSEFKSAMLALNQFARRFYRIVTKKRQVAIVILDEDVSLFDAHIP